MADESDSKSDGGNPVWVQVPLSAVSCQAEMDVNLYLFLPDFLWLWDSYRWLKCQKD